MNNMSISAVNKYCFTNPIIRLLPEGGAQICKCFMLFLFTFFSFSLRSKSVETSMISMYRFKLCAVWNVIWFHTKADLINIFFILFFNINFCRFLIESRIFFIFFTLCACATVQIHFQMFMNCIIRNQLWIRLWYVVDCPPPPWKDKISKLVPLNPN